MTFGFIGLFRKLCTRENNTIRYVSDSSYWLYVTHVPLIIVTQLAVRDWPLASGVKYFLVLLAVTGLLLLIYQFLVRYTWLGRLLNGPRRPPGELALHSHVREGIFVSAVCRIIEEDETHLSETIVRFEELLHRIKRDDRGLRDRITIHAGANGWEGNRLDAVLHCKP